MRYSTAFRDLVGKREQGGVEYMEGQKRKKDSVPMLATCGLDMTLLLA